MKMKKYLLTVFYILVLSAPLLSSAHDGGHGPKVTNVGLFGGLMTAVVSESDRVKGAHANLIYKAEIVKNLDGAVRIYLYDKKMKPLDLANFAKSADAVLISFVDGKEITSTFKLNLDKKNYLGTAPKPASKPFNIDIVFHENDKKYLAAFDGLDE
jgi:hypothetical protein